ncbi:unnamed protein product [Haemonchus placei]|uniref:Transposase n=1 Tax=Haemonchus placei TaxID=6290 RepID=A0A0N4W1I6_HAEPC|nr:unnamed protein product [Haemonchus placei]
MHKFPPVIPDRQLVQVQRVGQFIQSSFSLSRKCERYGFLAFLFVFCSYKILLAKM